MMNRQLRGKIDAYCNMNRSVYYNTIVPDARYTKYKYFFKYHNTHTVAKAFKTQKEMGEFLDAALGAYYKIKEEQK